MPGARSNIDEVPRGLPPTAAPGSGRLRVDPQQRDLQTGPVHWVPKKTLDRTAWATAGYRLGKISRCNQWWLGDWVRYGEKKWGETYTEAAKITGYDPRSLANMASISGSFDASRRRDKLTWSHHAAVAGLDVDDQELWLDQASDGKMSVSDLRIELRASQRSQLPSRSAASPRSHEIVCPHCGNSIDVSKEASTGQ